MILPKAQLCPPPVPEDSTGFRPELQLHLWGPILSRTPRRHLRLQPTLAQDSLPCSPSLISVANTHPFRAESQVLPRKPGSPGPPSLPPYPSFHSLTTLTQPPNAPHSPPFTAIPMEEQREDCRPLPQASAHHSGTHWCPASKALTVPLPEGDFVFLSLHLLTRLPHGRAELSPLTLTPF